MAYNFNVQLKTPKYTVEVDTKENYGYFEHVDYGEERGGGLWFQTVPGSEDGRYDRRELIDYDGVTHLPKQVAKALREAGFLVNETFD